MRDAFVEIKFETLRVDENHLDVVGRGFVEDGHHQGVDEDALTGAGGPSDEQVRHGSKIGDTDAAVKVASHGEGEFAGRVGEFGGFDDFAQRDGLALFVGDFDADGGFAGDAFDKDGFGLQREAR